MRKQIEMGSEERHKQGFIYNRHFYLLSTPGKNSSLPSSQELDTKTSSYIFRVFEGNYLVHYYYGATIPDTEVEELRFRANYASFCPDSPSAMVYNFSPDVTPLEYSTFGAGDFRLSAFAVENAE